VHPQTVRDEALALVALGMGDREVGEALGVARTTVRDWRRTPTPPPRRSGCPRCEDAVLDEEAYAELLGWYLGDGCLSRGRRDVWALRITNDARYADLNAGLARLLPRVRGRGTANAVGAPGCVVTSMTWKHWPCLFPQHGPGRKHERPIVLEPWQVAVVEQHPAAFLRGLFHSDGSRVRNWATRPVGGVLKRYDYPRWQFSNASEDILGLCGWALDLVDVAWRRSHVRMVSVSRREAVARLDSLIGPKS
jgi:hypothetical protein